MKKKISFLSLALACMLTLGLAQAALADTDGWTEGFVHNGHWHAGYETDAYGADDGYLTLAKDAKVYASADTKSDVLTTLKKDEVVCYHTGFDGWTHVYYNDGENVGWIQDGNLI